MNIAFYAPMKAPDHPVPSGDRTMARLLIRAMEQAGHQITVVSTLRSFLAAPDAAEQNALLAAAGQEAERIETLWSDGACRPDLWFTYHNHHKAPDLLGPRVTRRVGLPYVIAEASHAPRRAAAWGSWHEAAEAAIRRADLHICFTARDRAGLRTLLGDVTALVDLPPFIDASRLPVPAQRSSSQDVELITVAMMRPGDKLASYRFLAEALSGVADLPWRMTMIGDGPARQDVEQAFAHVPAERLRWLGMVEGNAVAAHLGRADLFAWPGFGEAFGLGYLEAQAMGVPVIACDTAGVSSVVRAGLTGLLTPPDSLADYQAALRRLICDPARSRSLGSAAMTFVRQERTIDRATAILDVACRQLVEAKGHKHAG